MCAAAVGAASVSVYYVVGAVVPRVRSMGPWLSESSRAWLTDRVASRGAAQPSRDLDESFPIVSALRWRSPAACSDPPDLIERVLRAMGLPFEAPELAVVRAPPDGGGDWLGA